MAKKIPRVVWDSCVIIDAIQRTPGRIDMLMPFLEDAENGQLEIVVSEISVAEVKHLRELENSKSADEIADLIRDWFDNSYIIRRNVHPGISEAAAQIGRVHKLKRAADAVVIATAIHENVETVHTFDGYKDPDGTTITRKSGLLKLDGKVGTPPVNIVVPDPGSGTLWSGNDDI